MYNNQVCLKNVVKDENLAVPEAKSYSYCSAYAMKIMENFPFHLFETSPNQNQHPSKKKNENSDWYGKSRKATNNSVGVYRIGTFLPSQDLPEDPSKWFHLFSKRYVKL